MPRSRRSHQQPRAYTTAYGGPHELGQNLLVDRRFPAAMADILRHAPPYPVLELGAGDGAVTRALANLASTVTAVELDPRKVAQLRAKLPSAVTVIHGDLLRYRFGERPHHVVSSVPFALTTPLLRRLVAQRAWHTAVLLVQWEVARKRAAIGGTTLFTACWWPWYEFSLGPRVPAAAFRPRPSVDGGILIITRRSAPLVAIADQSRYQQLVRNAFTGPGHTLPQALRRSPGRQTVRRLLAQQGLPTHARPRDLSANHWVALYRLMH